MGKMLEVKANGVHIYNIMFEKDYGRLLEVFEEMETKNHRICVVSDSNISRCLLEEVVQVLKPSAKKVVSYVFSAGEESKNLETVQGLYEYLVLEKFDRNDILVALGGGVVGDLTGFAAATYLRGIRFVQMPTSLLAMVDSSVGGKTGVDFLKYKNMVGAFHQPKAVYINLSVLKSLSEEHYFNGFGEVIKYGMIQDAEFLQWIKEHVEEIRQHDLEALVHVVYKSCFYKREIVERDPKEKGERALLNFGHTLGHSIEKASSFGLLHGQCVCLGMVAAAYISMKRGYIKEEDLNSLEDLLKQLNLPVRISGYDADEIIAGTKNDKKMEAGKIKFILLKEIGKAYIDHTVSDEEMKESLFYLMGK